MDYTQQSLEEKKYTSQKNDALVWNDQCLHDFWRIH